tara:strand:- start:166 stop:804 length:639 start_codon:yes stop_codon:yes gene_type:complete
LSDEEEIREAVDVAKAPGTFNIVDVLQNRSYPETQVSVVLEEGRVYEAAMLEEEIQKIEGKTSAKAKAALEDLVAKRESMREELINSMHTFYLMGIPEGKREELYSQAKKKYPIEYMANNDLSGILSGGSREEKDSPARDALFTDYLWQAHIKKIVNSEGQEQSEFSYATINTMRNTLPLSATIIINEAVEKLRSASALFTISTGEDFLAKP